MQTNGINAKNVKCLNRGLILRNLVTTPEPITRSELTARTGLSKMTVSNIIAEFLAQKLVCETPQKPDAPLSRSNPGLLEIAPDAPKLIGIRIRHRRCIATVCDMHLQTICTRIVPLDEEIFCGGSARGQILPIIRDLIAPFMEQYPILGIGIGSLGPVVDSENGTILDPSDDFGFQEIRIREYLHDLFHVPVFVDHTSSCAIRAEQFHDRTHAYMDAVYISMASGFDLGVIINGEIQSSHTGLSGSAGHICINMDGPLCYCGNRGCLEAFVTVDKLCRAAEASPLIHQKLTFAQLCEQSDRPAVHQLFMHGLLDYLVVALTNIVHLLCPEIIYLGDELARLPERYISYLEQEVNDHVRLRTYRYIRFSRAVVPTEDTAAFCAVIVLDDLFRNGMPSENEGE